MNYLMKTLGLLSLIAVLSGFAPNAAACEHDADEAQSVAQVQLVAADAAGEAATANVVEDGKGKPCCKGCAEECTCEKGKPCSCSEECQCCCCQPGGCCESGACTGSCGEGGTCSSGCCEGGTCSCGGCGTGQQQQGSCCCCQPQKKG